MCRVFFCFYLFIFCKYNSVLTNGLVAASMAAAGPGRSAESAPGWCCVSSCSMVSDIRSECCSPCSAQLTLSSAQNKPVCRCSLIWLFCALAVITPVVSVCGVLSVRLSDVLVAPGRCRRQYKLSLESGHTEHDL